MRQNIGKCSYTDPSDVRDFMHICSIHWRHAIGRDTHGVRYIPNVFLVGLYQLVSSACTVHTRPTLAPCEN